MNFIVLTCFNWRISWIVAIRWVCWCVYVYLTLEQNMWIWKSFDEQRENLIFSYTYFRALMPVPLTIIVILLCEYHHPASHCRQYGLTPSQHRSRREHQIRLKPFSKNLDRFRKSQLGKLDFLPAFTMFVIAFSQIEPFWQNYTEYESPPSYTAHRGRLQSDKWDDAS